VETVARCSRARSALADVAANVSDAIGKPLGPATTFRPGTPSRPGAVSSLAKGEMPIPLGMLGF
jgi:hypothetical protein